MIECHFLTKNAVYAWINLQDADSVAEISGHVRAEDSAAAIDIKNSDRRRVSLLGKGLLNYLAERMPAINDHVIARTTDGRPFLNGGSGNTVAFASISHSRDIVAAALDTRSSIGIDVEYCRSDRDIRRIAQRVFSADMADSMTSLFVFYKAWCLYEAWGKANNLDHIHAGRNSDLMYLIENWLHNPIDGESGDRSITFFAPDEHYAGCIFRNRNEEAVHAGNKIALEVVSAAGNTRPR